MDNTSGDRVFIPLFKLLFFPRFFWFCALPPALAQTLGQPTSRAVYFLPFGFFGTFGLAVVGDRLFNAGAEVLTLNDAIVRMDSGKLRNEIFKFS
ncbi:MAG: hypothetical protein RLP02_39180 [Coleofasciculus sp. C2-GNP5-27]